MRQIYIWGTANLAKKVANNMSDDNLIGFIETKKQKDVFLGKKVYQYDEIVKDYDAIIIANHYANEIYNLASEKNMCMDKFISMTTCYGDKKEKNLEWKKEILGKENFEIYVAERNWVEESFFMKDKERYSQLNKRKTFDIDSKFDYPILKDKYQSAGHVWSYFWQDLWAASLIHKEFPKEHYDIGSRLDGFIAHVLSFGIPVHMVDIRPFPTEIEGLDTIVADATTMDTFEDDSIESLSALCSLEHFGLGRYGDPVDPEACFKCFANIQRKMKKGGHLYISVPIGKEHVEFNAHRVFYPKTILDSFHEMELVEFSTAYNNSMEKNADIHKYDEEYTRGDRFGLFHFVK